MIPSKEHIRALLATAQQKNWAPGDGMWRPLLITALFTGLRCSELRGLTWSHVNLDAKVIQVRQRADLRNVMGSPKSEAGNRDVPMSSMVLNTLRAWKLACPVTALDLVFPSKHGRIVTNSTIHRSFWQPLQRAAGIEQRYKFHALRHAAASLFIEQGWTPKRVQIIMGHSTIQMTFDTYGHLWPQTEDDQTALAQIEARLGITS